MHAFVCAIVLAAALVGAAAAQTAPPVPTPPPTGGLAPAQSVPAALTPAQKSAILQAVRQEDRKIAQPSGLTARVGVELPPSLELYILPDAVLAEIPAAKSYKYTIIDNRVVLVDPTTMRVVDVLTE